MAKKILTDIDLYNNQIKNVTLENVSADKSTSGLPEGSFFYNSTDKKPKIYNGTAVVEVGGGGGVSDHGDLTGLGDDDHSQYLDTTRHSAVDHTGITGCGGIAAAPPYVFVVDEQTKTVAGGTFTQAGWRTRILNVIKTDTGSIASLSGNQLTLPAGTYKCYIATPAYYVNYHIARLKGISPNSSVLLYGSHEVANAGTYPFQNESIIWGTFTLAASNSLEIQHYCSTTRNTDGMGQAPFGGAPPADITVATYTRAHFWKLA